MKFGGCYYSWHLPTFSHQYSGVERRLSRGCCVGVRRFVEVMNFMVSVWL
jgi:hypothetical protein